MLVMHRLALLLTLSSFSATNILLILFPNLSHFIVLRFRSLPAYWLSLDLIPLLYVIWIRGYVHFLEDLAKCGDVFTSTDGLLTELILCTNLIHLLSLRVMVQLNLISKAFEFREPNQKQLNILRALISHKDILQTNIAMGDTIGMQIMHNIEKLTIYPLR